MSTSVRRLVAVGVAAALVAAVALAVRAGDVDPALTGAPAGVVVLPLGAELQPFVDAHPSGTRFVIAAGVHRLQQLVPRSGDRFVGEPGAVLSGARVLPPDAFERRDGRWVIGGQTQQGAVRAPVMVPGHEAEAAPEELFVDGRRLRRVGSLDEVDRPGTWFLDIGDDTLWMADDPHGFDVVEASVAPFAFAASGADDVHVSDLEIRHYASPAQGGAVDATDASGWRLERLAVVDNHGTGIRVGPGATVERCDVRGNGQLGIGGVGTSADDGSSGPIVIRSCRVSGNHVLGFHWPWEAGGIKITGARDVVVANTWVEGHVGPGIWFDLGVDGATVCANLVERNGMGIFVEVSRDVDVHGNVVRDNTAAGHGDASAAFYVSESQDVRIRGNLASGQTLGVRARQVDRPAPVGHVAEVRGLVVEGNDLAFAEWSGLQVLDDDLDAYTTGGNRFVGNTYRTDAAEPFWWLFGRQTLEGWQASGHDLSGSLLPGGGVGALPRTATAFSRTSYGPAAGPGGDPGADAGPPDARADRCDEASA